MRGEHCWSKDQKELQLRVLYGAYGTIRDGNPDDTKSGKETGRRFRDMVPEKNMENSSDRES